MAIRVNLQMFGGRGASGLGGGGGAGGAGNYAGYTIEPFGKNDYTVLYQGDEVVFGSVEEAKKFIDEMNTADYSREYSSFLANHADVVRPTDLKAGDKVITRAVSEDGKRDWQMWKGTGEDRYLGDFKPVNDVTLTKVTETSKQVKMQGYTKNAHGRKLSVSKTVNKNQNVFTRK